MSDEENKQVFERVRFLINNLHLAGEVEMEEGKAPYYSDSFRCEDGEEPGDVSWDMYCEAQRVLKENGMVLDDFFSDNDSIAGKVRMLGEKE